MGHLGHPNSTAGAAINIVAVSTVDLVDDQGLPLVDKQSVIARIFPSGKTTSARGSDPSICQDIYNTCRRHRKVTLANPVSVLMKNIDTSGWSKPDGNSITAEDGFVTIARGSPGAVLRYRIRVPEGRGFVLGDCSVGGRAVDFGGQLVWQSLQVFLRIGTYRYTDIPEHVTPDEPVPSGGDGKNPASGSGDIPVPSANGGEKPAGGGGKPAPKKPDQPGGAGQSAAFSNGDTSEPFDGPVHSKCCSLS